MAATMEMMMKNSPKIQFLLQVVFEDRLPDRYPKLIPPQQRCEVIKLTKAFIRDAYGAPPVVTQILPGFMRWSPESLHFDPYRESMWYNLSYQSNPFTAVLDPSSWSVTMPKPVAQPKSKNKFSTFMNKPNHRPKKIKAKGNR